MAKVEVSDRSKMPAAMSYGSFFLGIPLGVVPLFMRDDPFAFVHALAGRATSIHGLAGPMAPPPPPPRSPDEPPPRPPKEDG